MEILITDEEKKALKDNALYNVGARLERELYTEVYRSVTREVSKNLIVMARQQIESRVKELIITERIEKAILDAIKDCTIMAHGSYGRPFIQEQFSLAVEKIAKAQAQAVQTELSNLLYLALRKSEQGI